MVTLIALPTDVAKDTEEVTMTGTVNVTGIAGNTEVTGIETETVTGTGTVIEEGTGTGTEIEDGTVTVTGSKTSTAGEAETAVTTRAVLDRNATSPANDGVDTGGTSVIVMGINVTTVHPAVILTAPEVVMTQAETNVDVLVTHTGISLTLVRQRVQHEPRKMTRRSPVSRFQSQNHQQLLVRRRMTFLRTRSLSWTSGPLSHNMKRHT